MVLIACTSDPPAPTEPVPMPEAWTGVRACGTLRVLATAGDRALALDLRAVDLVQAARDQVPLEVERDFADSDAHGVVQQGLTEDDVCGSIEEFPPFGLDPHHVVTGGTVFVRFTPHAGLDADGEWVYDGTEIGTVHVELRDLELSPPGVVDDLDLDVPYSVADLPA